MAGSPGRLGADYQYEDIFQVIRDGLSYQGKLFAAPFYGESSFTSYRKDLFAKAGLEMPEQPSYEQIRIFAAKLHDPAHNVYGICLRGAPGWGSNMAYLSTMVNTFGGRWTIWHGVRSSRVRNGWMRFAFM